MWYHVAEANSYLAITGAGVDSVAVKKKAFIYPFQKVSKFSITPFDFSMTIQAMTVEKLKFSLPAVFTIGPDDTNASLMKYAVLLTGEESGAAAPKATFGAVAVGQGRGHVQDIVKGIIEGETRSIVSTMTMEELFQERRVFRDKVIKNVQSELDQFGLKIYNANVKELQDTPGSEYFAYLSRKAHEGALNQAKVDVADARMKGEVGESERQGKTKQEVAKIHAATAVLETERKAEKALADAALAEKEINIEKDLNLSRISAKRAAEARDAELQKNVELKRAEMELEKQRATTVTKAVITRESDQEKAKAQLFTQEKQAAGLKAQQTAEADAAYYRVTKDAEASKLAKQEQAAGLKAQQLSEADTTYYCVTKESEAQNLAKQQQAAGSKAQQILEADASYYAVTKKAEAAKLARQLDADAEYYALKQESQGLVEIAKGYGALANVLGGPQGLLQYLMLRNDTHEKLALANAKAINGLQPKINVWNTGAQGEGVADPTAPIRNLFQTLPPLMSTINEQTGIQPPSWLLQMPQDQPQLRNGTPDHVSGKAETIYSSRASM